MEKDYSMLDQQCVRSAQEVEQLKADKAQISTLLSSKGNCGESEREMTREKYHLRLLLHLIYFIYSHFTNVILSEDALAKANAYALELQLALQERQNVNKLVQEWNEKAKILKAKTLQHTKVRPSTLLLFDYLSFSSSFFFLLLLFTPAILISIYSFTQKRLKPLLSKSLRATAKLQIPKWMGKLQIHKPLWWMGMR